jgi:diguanylate cyclase (GGDEF)-like protein
MPIHDAPLVLVAIAIATIAGLYVRLWCKLRQRSAGEEREPGFELRGSLPKPDPGLALLKAVADLSVSSQDAEAIANGVLGEMHTHRSFDRITLSVVDGSRREIVIRARAGDENVSSRSDAANTPTESLSIPKEQPPADKRAGASLSLPLNYGDTLLGLLKIETLSGEFGPADVQIGKICAALLASSLQNALLARSWRRHSITDDVTGGKTRQYFLDALEREWTLSSRHDRPFSIVMLSLCGLSVVEAAMGPLERNLALARVGRLLEQKCRRSNLVARYQEDVFALLMPETRAEQAQALAERLRLWVESDPVLKERGITGSFGVATYPLDGSNIEELLERAREQNGLAMAGNRIIGGSHHRVIGKSGN